MLMSFIIFSLFGPLYGNDAIPPLNEFKGSGLIIPNITLLYNKSNDTTFYFSEGYAGMYYNIDQHTSVGLDFKGRFYYAQLDNTLSKFYPDLVKAGIKFGFPITKRADMGIGTYVETPIYRFTHKDSLDLQGFPVSNKVSPGLSIYHMWKDKNLAISTNMSYRGRIYGNLSFSLNLSTTFSYKFKGTRFFITPQGVIFPGIKEHPKEFALSCGTSFLSPFNSSFTIYFTIRPIVSEVSKGTVFLAENSYKYGIGIAVESWFPEKNYTRYYMPRKEKTPSFVLIKRFYRLNIKVMDKKDTSTLKNVKLNIYQKNNLIKSFNLNGTFKIDSLKRGKYTFSFEKERYKTKTLKINIKKDTQLIVLLEKRPLKDSGTLKIQIKDQNNKPISNARIYIVDLNTYFTSDTLGRVNLKLKAGTYLIRFQKSGFRPVSRYIVIKREEDKKEVIIMKKK